MEYRGYKVYQEKDRLLVENVRDFDPIHIFECGQCFRWIRQEDGSYEGIVREKAIRLNYRDGLLELHNSIFEDFQHIWYDYLDLGRDYGRIKDILSSHDENLRKAVEFGKGMRLLRQDLWETLISFIISANNMIPRIMKIVAAIANVYGDEVVSEGKKFYTFPQADRLADSSVEELSFCRGGFRCKYIVNTAIMAYNGEAALDRLVEMDTGAAREELLKLPGVGPKVADCVLLYSGTKYDVFPTDVWVKRVMEELYFGREASFKEIQEFAARSFGELAGFAQQYLFYYARAYKIGVGK